MKNLKYTQLLIVYVDCIRYSVRFPYFSFSCNAKQNFGLFKSLQDNWKFLQKHLSGNITRTHILLFLFAVSLYCLEIQESSVL